MLKLLASAFCPSLELDVGSRLVGIVLFVQFMAVLLIGVVSVLLDEFVRRKHISRQLRLLHFRLLHYRANGVVQYDACSSLRIRLHSDNTGALSSNLHHKATASGACSTALLLSPTVANRVPASVHAISAVCAQAQIVTLE
eukprot:14139-Heterococcus_DN1.PRE.5